MITNIDIERVMKQHGIPKDKYSEFWDYVKGGIEDVLNDDAETFKEHMDEQT